MDEVRVVLAETYAAFNRRDVDGALARMREDVSWPKASEGGSVVGKEEIRAYWGRQWAEFDPMVTPVEMIERADGKVDVRVRQVVKSLGGDVLFDGEVWHTFTFRDGLIARMDLEDGLAERGASAAFARHE